MYAIKIGRELFKVRGNVLPSGWLEWRGWKDTSDQGVSQPGSWSEWSDRQAHFPDCADSTD